MGSEWTVREDGEWAVREEPAAPEALDEEDSAPPDEEDSAPPDEEALPAGDPGELRFGKVELAVSYPGEEVVPLTAGEVEVRGLREPAVPDAYRAVWKIGHLHAVAVRVTGA